MIFSIKKLTYVVLALALHASAQAGVLSDHQGHWMGDLKIPNGPTFKSAVEIFTRADTKMILKMITLLILTYMIMMVIIPLIEVMRILQIGRAHV